MNNQILLGVFGLGGPEMILIVVAILIFFGGSKIPELAKGLGKGIREFKDAASSDSDKEKANSEKKDA